MTFSRCPIVGWTRRAHPWFETLPQTADRNCRRCLWTPAIVGDGCGATRRVAGDAKRAGARRDASRGAADAECRVEACAAEYDDQANPTRRRADHRYAVSGATFDPRAATESARERLSSGADCKSGFRCRKCCVALSRISIPSWVGIDERICAALARTGPIMEIQRQIIALA
jgi:hypothetical protein